MEETEKTTSVVNIPTGTKVNEQDLQRATAELDTFQKGMKDKLYSLKVSNEKTLSEFIDFVENKAEWKAMEALGIEQLSKKLSEAKIKGGFIFLGTLEIEALHYFLSKVTGKGLKSAENHLKMVRTVNDALKLVKADNTQLTKLESTVAAISNGIKMEESTEEEVTKSETTEQN